MNVPNDYKEFRRQLQLESPPDLWPEALKALWWDAKGCWEISHEIAQDLPSETGSWIHAYLHRKEGDEWNAGYWYRRAKKPFPEESLDREAESIISWIIEKGQ
jgi:hypothetical protein